MIATASTAGAVALRYAARGIGVFPINADTKRPLTTGGFHDASTDPDVIRAWWRRHSAAGLAIPTGKASGVVVIDFDRVDAIVELVDRFGQLPPTPSVRTPSGGMHFYFRAPVERVACSVSKLAAGVDVRGDGGYVAVPPTRRADGRAYKWAHADTIALAALPAPWSDAIAAPPLTPAATPAEAWINAVYGPVLEGQRDQSLTRLVGHLLRRHVDARVVLALAYAVNARACRPPLDDRDVERIVGSISGRELSRRLAA